METGLPEKLCRDYNDKERTTMPVSSHGTLITHRKIPNERIAREEFWLISSSVHVAVFDVMPREKQQVWL